MSTTSRARPSGAALLLLVLVAACTEGALRGGGDASEGARDGEPVFEASIGLDGPRAPDAGAADLGSSTAGLDAESPGEDGAPPDAEAFQDAEAPLADRGPVAPLDAGVVGPADVGPTSRRLVVIDPSEVGENWLPGCAGRPSADPNSCRLSGTITDEIYAIRFQFNGLDPSIRGTNAAPIGLDSRDAMYNADVENRYFQISISTVPGDFLGVGPHCTTPENQAAASIQVLDERQLMTLSGRDRISAEATSCVLAAPQALFINVMPKNPGCVTSAGRPPTDGICRIRVFNQVPGSSGNPTDAG